MKKINQSEAIEILKSDRDISKYEIVFNDEKVEALQVILLGRNGLRVPEHLIYYDDDAIDFSDIPESEDGEFDYENLVEIIETVFHVRKEIFDWLEKEKINKGELLAKLLTDFYDTQKKIMVKYEKK